MTMEQMWAVADTIRIAWEAAATDSPALSFLFEEGAPYLTIWDHNRCQCKHGRILDNVYNVPAHRRTAQAFLCIMPGENDEAGIDVVNVHAPSGKPRLTDPQRFELIRNLLQSNSKARANRRIGQGRFLFGGDMNTKEVRLAQNLIELRSRGILQTKTEVLLPTWGKHGDMCVVGGFTTTLVSESARNHDPEHVPYGIAWRIQAQHATEQLTTTPLTQIPTAPDTKKEFEATGSIAAAVATRRIPKQQPHRDTATTWTTTEQPQPDPQEVAVRPERHLPQLPLEKVCQTAWPATEQPDEPVETVTVQHRNKGMHRTEAADAETTRPTTEQSQSDTEEPPTQKGPDQMGTPKPKTKASLDADTETTRHATEQPGLDENEPPALNGPEQELAYAIVNAFLDNVTSHSGEAEILIRRIILNTGEWHSDMLHNIDEVFRPIFFNYPKNADGLIDRTRAEPRDASQYIKQWREIAEWREWVRPATEQTGDAAMTPLTRSEEQSILHQYINNFINKEADTTQRALSWNKNKSFAEARLRRLCGSVMMTKVIWRVGLPNVPEALFAREKVLAVLGPATEQPRRLEPDVLDAMATATQRIVIWLNMLAESIQSHKATPVYQEHARKSGFLRKQSGLNAAELRLKEEKKHEAYMRHGHRQWTSGAPEWQWQCRWR